MRKAEFHKRLNHLASVSKRIKQEIESGHELEALYVAQEANVGRQFTALLAQIADWMPALPPVVDGGGGHLPEQADCAKP